jgi:hypothetical protein
VAAAGTPRENPAPPERDRQPDPATGEDAAANVPAEPAVMLRAVWRAFNRWRRGRWHVRVLILLIVFAMPLYEQLANWSVIGELVRAACDAIMVAYVPRLEYTLRKHYRTQEAARMQQALALVLDVDRDGVLGGAEVAEAERLGVSAEHFGASSRADLSALISASRRAGLVPPTQTEEELLWKTYYAARGSAEALSRPWRSEVKAELEVPREWPDYTDPVTWQRGAQHFVRCLLVVPAAGTGRPSGLILWFLLALMLTMAVRGHRPAAGAACGAALASVLRLGPLWRATRAVSGVLLLQSFGVLCLGTAVGLGAGRLGARLRDRLVAALASACLLGLTLAGTAVPGMVVRHRLRRATGGALPSGLFREARIAGWGAVCSGAGIALYCGVALIVLLRRRRTLSRRACPPGEAGSESPVH